MSFECLLDSYQRSAPSAALVLLQQTVSSHSAQLQLSVSIGNWVPRRQSGKTSAPSYHGEMSMTRETGVLMTACTQPGCTGTIVDGYCDVCGSPAGAVPFVPGEAAASAGLPAPDPKDEGLNIVCIEPGCTGTIVDGYCDVCGSPAGAVPFVPAEAAASAGSSAPAEESGLTASPAPIPAPALVDEEIPTQQIPDEPAEHEPDGAEDYRTRVEEAKLPDDVRNAALSEVGELERTDDQSPESGEIRTWLDTVLDLPWSPDTMESIDIEAEREVDPAAADIEEPHTEKVEPEEADTAAADTEQVNSGKADPAAADTEEADTEKIEPVKAEAASPPDTEQVDTAKADTKKTDTAAAGPHDDDTVEVPAVLAVHGRGSKPHPPQPEQQVLAPVVVQNPAEKRRFRSLVVAAIVLAALLIGAFLFGMSRDRGVTARSAPTVSGTAASPLSTPASEFSESANTGREESTIQLEDLPDIARPFEAVRIQGTYSGGADTFLRVERWEGGKWLAFPVPTKTDQSGRFTAYAEFGQPGRYRLRVLDPDSGVTSKPFVLVIEA